jgi:N-methylhydantoinase A
VTEVLQRLEDEAAAELRAAGADGNLGVLRSVDMRYKGQVHEVSVPIARNGHGVDADRIVQDFHLQYERRYGQGTTNPAAPVEAMSWEVRAAAVANAPAVVELPEVGGGGFVAPKTRRPVYFRGGWQDVAIFARDALQAGSTVTGPAVIEASDTTILVNPGDQVRMDRFGNLVMEVQ